MVHVCYNGMSENESQNMLDNVVAMTDLSEDEGSPRHGMTGDNAQTEIFRAYQAYQAGLDLIQGEATASARGKLIWIGEFA